MSKINGPKFTMKKTWVLSAFLLCGLGLSVQLDAAQARLSRADLERRKSASSERGRVWALGDRAIALYPDRLEFFELEAGESIDPRGRLKRGDRIREPLEVKPFRIAWFARPTNVVASSASNMIVCTASWAKKSGPGTDDFCGIMSAGGEVVYRFPVKQRPPKTVLQPLAISDDGLYAEVYVGPLVDSEDGPSPGAPEEVLAWRYPSELSRFPGPWKGGAPREPAVAFDNLLQGFKERQKKR